MRAPVLPLDSGCPVKDAPVLPGCRLLCDKSGLTPARKIVQLQLPTRLVQRMQCLLWSSDSNQSELPHERGYAEST